MEISDEDSDTPSQSPVFESAGYTEQFTAEDSEDDLESDENFNIDASEIQKKLIDDYWNRADDEDKKKLEQLSNNFITQLKEYRDSILQMLKKVHDSNRIKKLTEEEKLDWIDQLDPLNFFPT